MRLRVVAAIWVNWPPAYTSDPDTSSAFTVLFAAGAQSGSTVPSGSSLARRLRAIWPPTEVKAPATETSAPSPAAAVVVFLAPGSHGPASPVDGETRAIRLRGCPPICVKEP